MRNLFEEDNTLQQPVECFLFDAAQETFPVKPHWHYFAEVIYMCTGEAEMTADGETFLAKPGELIVFPPSSVHTIAQAGTEMPVYQVLKFDLGKLPSTYSYAPSPVSMFRVAREKGMPMHFDRTTAAEMECSALFTDCIREIKQSAYGYDVMLRAQLYRLVYRIIRYWIGCGLNPDICAVQAEEHSLESVTEYIDSRLSEHIRVQDIADHFHLSYSAFSVRFRAQYGMSCKQYIERMRIFKAEEYLLMTDYDLTTISLKTGFSDCSHMIKCFREYRGMTPKQYRISRRQSPNQGEK